MTHFQNKVILITGGSRGIGRAISIAFAKEKATVIINYKTNNNAANETVQECKSFGANVEAIKTDIKNEDEVQDMIEYIINKYGKLSCLVNNAFAPFKFDVEQRQMADQVSWDEYDTQFQGAIKYAYNTIHYCLPYLKEEVESSIINITSNLTKRPVIPYHQYNVAKSALESFTKNLAMDLGRYNIRVNCIAPGLVYPTNGTYNTKEKLKESIMSQTPLGRIATPEDIAGPTLFLASKWSQFVTGQVLYVDGGFTI
ncbi:SDR family oxidoreductase [Staphylococcus haemolyticus]|uniref:SDR family oxidoreductase n=1 Tax=Staphylococcus haemolyticus TaxID=1283 RepID=UPI00069FE9E3|nr:SDR family oxidoreductase [Staphylococcus haemolyticus]